MVCCMTMPRYLVGQELFVCLGHNKTLMAPSFPIAVFVGIV
jgi:hypothetical protein